MLSERYLKRRYEEGQAEERKAWEGWNRRRIAAKEAGEEFNEPPPSGQNGNQGNFGARAGFRVRRDAVREIFEAAI